MSQQLNAPALIQRIKSSSQLYSQVPHNCLSLSSGSDASSALQTHVHIRIFPDTYLVIVGPCYRFFWLFFFSCQLY